ncbi:hypothetical protein RRG08_000465 [Elysia crispata]|uniref:Uncharacterized protein n=1 Tax=Elysia crispata TaxID=231223 RepID=A0AAE0YC49_9GAST|nr:hypothetical protein RRG08_000465 [Elysia crispata]
MQKSGKRKEKKTRLKTNLRIQVVPRCSTSLRREEREHTKDSPYRRTQRMGGANTITLRPSIATDWVGHRGGVALKRLRRPMSSPPPAGITIFAASRPQIQ